MLKKLGQFIILILVMIGGYYIYTTVFGATTIKNQDLQNGLVGYWSFEEGNGTQAGDMSGYGNDGVLTNMDDVDWIAGKVGGGLNFDGVNDAIHLDSLISTIQNDTTGTISVWAKIAFDDGQPNALFTIGDNDGGDGIFIMTYGMGSNSDNISLQLNADGVIQWRGTTTVDSIDPYVGEWLHIALVQDGVEPKIYFNGVEQSIVFVNALDKTAWMKDLIADATSKADNVRIGELYIVGGSYSSFEGGIDELRMYNRALSHEEVRALHSQSAQKVQVTQKNILTEGLTAHWTFDGPDMIGATSTDQSGNARDLGLYDGAYVDTGVLGQGVYLPNVIANGNTYERLSQFITESEGSMSIWFKPEGASAENANAYDLPAIVGDISAYVGIFRGKLTLGEDKIWFYNWDGNQDRVGVTYENNEWVHLVWVHTGGTLYAYKNGQLIDSVASGPTEQMSSRVRLGDGYNVGVVGRADEVRMYNRALSADEIKLLYNTSVGTKINTTQENQSITGLLGHWSFDGPYMDWASTTVEVLDSSGNGNNGSAASMNTKSAVRGIVGQALYFDGSGADYIDLGDKAVWEPTGADSFSVGFWFKEANGYFIGHSLQSLTNFWYIKDNATLFCGSSTCTASVNSTYTLPNDSDWHHFVATLDRSTSPDTLTIYIDGTIEDQATSTLDGQNTTWGSDTIIGKGYWAGGVDNYEGYLDEFRIYDVALTEEDVLDMYTRESGKNRLDVGLVGYWPFRAGVSTVARDYSDNDNHGTLNNMEDADWTTGKAGYGLSLDGVDEHVRADGLISTVENDTQGTISLWAKLATDDGNINNPFAMGDSDGLDGWLAMEFNMANDYVSMQLLADGTLDWRAITPVNSLDPYVGEWLHITLVQNGVEPKIYFNGVEQAITFSSSIDKTTWMKGMIADATNKVDNVSFGEIYLNSASFSQFEGDIDEVRVYNRALSVDEVYELYDSSR